MSETDYNCNKCKSKDTERMVQCDTCDKWFHFECVGVNSDVANISWSCSCGIEQPVALQNSRNSAPNMMPVNTTGDFSVGAQGSSSPKKQITGPINPSVPGPSYATSQTNGGHDKGAYPKARQNEGNHGSINMTPITTTMPNSVNMQGHFEDTNGPNTTACNMSSQIQLQLQMLEEEKDLQRKYLEMKYKILLRSDESQATGSFLSSFLSTQPTSTQINARQVIPKELPNFDGNPEDWPLFISNYKNSTEIAGYSDAENLMRLQSCLRGRAKELVKSKLLIPSMVGEIIETLEMCFGRPEHILDTMIEKATKIPPLKDKLESIIEYALTIRNICSTMEACNMVAYLNNPMLVKTLLDKLPSNHKLNWAMFKKDEKVPVVKVFSDWIYSIAAAVSQVVSPVAIKKSASVNIHQQNHTYKPVCFSCKSEAHKIQNCGEFQSLTLDEKWNLVKDNNLCRKCLKFHRRKCFSNKSCGMSGCAAKHHPLLHKYVLPTPATEHHGNVNVHSEIEEGKQCFRIVPIRVYYNGGSVNTYAFLDEGSTMTLMEKQFFDTLGVKGKPEPLEMCWTGGTTRSDDKSVKLTVEVSGLQSDTRFALYNVHTVYNLDLPTQSMNFEQICKNNPYLKGLPIQSYNNVKPMILIGLNNWNVAVPLKIREGKRDQPIASKTRLGWALQGSGTGMGVSSLLNIHSCDCGDRYKMLHEEVKGYFSLEVAKEKNIMSSENKKALEILENGLEIKNQQYEVNLLWRDKNLKLPESYNVACHRLKCLQKKFKKDTQLQQTMQEEIDKLLNKGYARRVLDSEMFMYPDRTWYLPIFVAHNPNKPGKVRLVWDAAAKSKEKCLNDFLMSGPDLLTSLFNILMEFRVGQIGICGDIAEMFHRINVKDEDMHAQRFLWLNDADLNQQPGVYVMKALTFGTSCAPCIAHFVRNKNAQKFRDMYPRAVKAVDSYHYMDDFIDSVDSEEEALELATQVKMIHAAGGFYMRNWATNSQLVRQHLSEDGSAAGNSFGAIEKILGMYWESNNDVFQYNSRFSRLKRDVFKENVVPTKRESLQVLMSIFDPLGLVSHCNIGLKILLQNIWRSGIKWDEELTEDLMQKWSSWLLNLSKITSVTIPRCYSKLLKMTSSVQLHTFVDAGENAYAAVCYFRIQYKNDVDICIVAAKSKVAPLKPVSIPRLELQAALIGTRLAGKIQDATRLHCTEKFFWSDSKTVLKWLSMDPKNFKPFVMYRVGEILESTNVTQWNWVPSKLNPADFATKVCAADNKMWFRGPQFLKEDESNWPKCSDLGIVNTEEVRNHLLHISKADSFTMNIEYFSCWRRLYRALSKFLEYMEKLKSVACSNEVKNDLQFECVLKAKNILFKYAQRSDFSEEIRCLKNKEQIARNSSLNQLNIFLDDNGVLRSNGRAENLSCNYAIILPKNHYITFLVVRYYHENFHHCMHEAIICKIKSIFYIPKLRVLYKTVRSKCQRCKNESAVPRLPQMASLPKARLSSFERPFTYVGIDFFGPLYATVGRRKEKRWGVLFTCLTVRAVHIEVAHSLDTSSCIMCIQNFVSRRGSPREIYTDNGTNFKAVEKILREEKQNLDLRSVFSKHDEIKWRFNPPASPHMGGAWERLIRSVKSILYSMCPAFKFNDETLRCALWEIEFIINSRPLTFVALDSADDEALTPNHLLLGSPDGYKPLVEHDLRQRWHQTQNFANHFWRRWVREYGPNLVRRSKWFEKVQPPSVGDVVIIVDDTLPRNSWPKGVIVEVVAAKDGQVRRVKIKTNSGIYERPIAKVAVLDVGNVNDGKLLDA